MIDRLPRCHILGYSAQLLGPTLATLLSVGWFPTALFNRAVNKLCYILSPCYSVAYDGFAHTSWIIHEIMIEEHLVTCLILRMFQPAVREFERLIEEEGRQFD